jgi:hypothetical protein
VSHIILSRVYSIDIDGCRPKKAACCKCSAPAVTDDGGDAMCQRCYDTLPEIDDKWAGCS